MSLSNLARCLDCGHLVSRLAETCPACGRLTRRPVPREGLFLRTLNDLVALALWVPALLVAVILIAAVAGYLSAR